ncbi:DNA-binding protein [Halobacterium wangiae]|uniref:DNA-binding protein n=1 Tax=Halobacterium wangiae TaxID=2902623 RepID=UPI001E63FF74|nr:DNA-binding protein [Halobacterium wangiae]
MSSKQARSKVVSVEEQTFEQTGEQAVDEDGFELVDETPEFRATVELEIQAKVAANHSDGLISTRGERIRGATLEEEERIRGREAELERIRARALLGSKDGRAERTRTVVAKQSVGRRRDFEERAGSVDPWADPNRGDPREALTREQLAAVNAESVRLARALDGWSRAAISRRLAEPVADGVDVTSAVLSVFEQLQTAPGHVIPIGKLEDVNRKEVSIEGRIEVLWNPSHPSIAQVGLIEDESGRVKFTVWERSNQPIVREGEVVRFRGAAKNWYEGRCSLALTGWSRIHFPERDAWWGE